MSGQERSYLRSIRNPVKRAYGFDYVNWLERGSMAEDTPPPAVPAGLSYMAAQAVRMRLADIRAKVAAECAREFEVDATDDTDDTSAAYRPAIPPEMPRATVRRVTWGS